MPLKRSEVEHVAHLAHIALSPSEVDDLTSQLSAVIDHIATLQRVNTDRIEPTAHGENVRNVMRDDDVRPSWPPESVVANAPRTMGEFIEVQAILD